MFKDTFRNPASLTGNERNKGESLTITRNGQKEQCRVPSLVHQLQIRKKQDVEGPSPDRSTKAEFIEGQVLRRSTFGGGIPSGGAGGAFLITCCPGFLRPVPSRTPSSRRFRIAYFLGHTPCLFSFCSPLSLLTHTREHVWPVGDAASHP